MEDGLWSHTEQLQKPEPGVAFGTNPVWGPGWTHRRTVWGRGWDHGVCKDGYCLDVGLHPTLYGAQYRSRLMTRIIAKCINCLIHFPPSPTHPPPEIMPFTIDTVAVFLRGTILNPALVAAVAGAATLSLDQAALAAYKIPFTLAQPQLASCVLAAAGAALRLHEYLTRGTANNWTTDSTWDWSKEIVVVTGASGAIGIGAGVVRDLLARNPATTIVVVDYVPMAWQPAPGTGTNLHYYQCDLSDKEYIRSLCQRIRAEVGDPTVLVNNAGLGRGATVMEGTYADVELTINTNLLAPFLLIKEFLPHMVTENHGHIVNVSSMSSVMPPAQIADYAATKAGLAALHEVCFLPLLSPYISDGA